MPKESAEKGLEPAVEGEELHLIYKIEGRPHEVDIFDLSRALEGIGRVLNEGNRLLYPETELVLRVSPFAPGSFIMDIAVHVQSHPVAGTIFTIMMSQPEFLKQAKQLLEYVGLIKKTTEYGVSFLELLRKLRNGKPEKVEKKGEAFEYRAQGGALIPVSAPVHNLYNSGVVNNYIINIAAPVDRPEVIGVKTFLKNLEAATGVQITKEDVPAIRAYVEPPINEGAGEILENTNIYWLHPKSGSYGETKGQWTFKIAGSSTTLKARITDARFLANYENGVIRFFAKDRLKARVRERQFIEGSKVTKQNDIIEVLEYIEAHPSERR